MQLGDRIFAEITKDMSLDVPEGSYTLAVANNGWGGSTDIEIKRGETTKVNLNDLKGEGPKKSSILFEVDVQGAKIYVDGSEIDYTSPVEITYGKHTLKVTADGYDTWTRTLYVNSKEATIQITINDDTDSSANDSSVPKLTAPAVHKPPHRHLPRQPQRGLMRRTIKVHLGAAPPAARRVQIHHGEPTINPLTVPK